MRSPLSAPSPVPVEIPRPGDSPAVLQIAPLPLGFQRRWRELGLLPPETPVRVARDSAGRPLKDALGQAVVMADPSDADYRSLLELYHQRLAALVVVEALRHDPNVSFQSTLAGCRHEGPRYADAVYAELAEAGWTDGDLARVCHEAARLSNLLNHDVQQAQRNFSMASPPPT